MGINSKSTSTPFWIGTFLKKFYFRPPEHVSRFYAKGALQFIVPILMQTLAKQEEFDDDDDWNPCKAAGVCLMLLATCCGDDIVQHCLPFVREHIRHTDWRYKPLFIFYHI